MDKTAITAHGEAHAAERHDARLTRLGAVVIRRTPELRLSLMPLAVVEFAHPSIPSACR